jgi:hypothetical protein
MSAEINVFNGKHVHTVQEDCVSEDSDLHRAMVYGCDNGSCHGNRSQRPHLEQQAVQEDSMALKMKRP